MPSRLPHFRLKPWMGALRGLLHRLGRWWLEEFLALFPEQFAPWLLGQGRKTLVLATEGAAFGLQLLDAGRRTLASARIERESYSPASIDGFLRSHGLERKDVAVGARLPADRFFGRTLILPVEAARALDEVVVRDLTKKTPFRLPDIYHDHATSRAAGANRIVVRQWLVRRDFVADALAPLQLDVEDLDFLDAEAQREAPSPCIALHPDRAGRGSRVRATALALTFTSLLLGLAAGGLEYRRQQSILDELATRIEATKATAQQVRAAIDKLEQKQAVLLHLRSRKGDAPGLLDAWEEATRILPAHSWLIELRLSELADKHEQRLAMVGFSAAAPSLVALIDRSPLFGDVSLTAPIALDPLEGRERFALQAKLRKRPELKQASR